MPQPTTRKAHLDSLAVCLLLACCMFWGFQQVLVKATVAEVAPVFQAFVRFALATVGFRGGALALGAETPWLSGAWGVLLAQSLQSIGLGAWVARRTPQGLAPLWRAWRVSLLTGAMGAAASLAWFTAYALQSVGPVRTLGMIEVVFSYFVSRRILSEHLLWQEKVGMLTVVAGLLLVCLQ